MSTLTFNEVKEIRTKVAAMTDDQLQEEWLALTTRHGERTDYQTAFGHQLMWEYQARERERQGLPKYPTGEDEDEDE